MQAVLGDWPIHEIPDINVSISLGDEEHSCGVSKYTTTHNIAGILNTRLCNLRSSNIKGGVTWLEKNGPQVDDMQVNYY